MKDPLWSETCWSNFKYFKIFYNNSSYELYRVSIKSFPDYKHLLHENYVEYKRIFYNYLNYFLKIYAMYLL